MGWSLSRRAVEVRQRLRPHLCPDQTTAAAAFQVRLHEVNPAVAPRDSRLVGRLRERRPRQREVRRRCRTGLHLRAASPTVAEAPNASLPVNDFRTSAPAALKVLWPDMNSG